jgi:hypothetical protein
MTESSDAQAMAREHVTNAPGEPQSRGNVDAGAISPRFKLLFLSTFGITLLSMLGMVLLPFFASESHDPAAAAETCATVFKMGVGVLFGLISGKATD